MKLKTIIKNNDSKTIAYTFTKDEARIKFPSFINENVYNFGQLITNFLYQNNQQKSLRGTVFVHENKFTVTLKDNNKKIAYTIDGNNEKIMEIKDGQ